MKRIFILHFLFLFVALHAKGQGSLGFVGTDVSMFKKYWETQGYQAVDLGTDKGVYVDLVRYNGAAQRSGIAPYDVITAIDGVQTPTFDDLKAYLSKKRVGSAVNVSILRYKQRYTIKVILERPINEQDYFVDGYGNYSTYSQVVANYDYFLDIINPDQDPVPNPDTDPIIDNPVPEPTPTNPVSDVDKNIPTRKKTNNMTYAVIIGNEKYENESNVPYAENDAKVFKEYVTKTLCVPENHIRYVTNGGLNSIRMAVRFLKEAMAANGGKGKALFYYAGHGIPDEASKTAYLLPTDGMGGDAESAYPLSRLYNELGQSSAQCVTIFLDACFSGKKRDGDMMKDARSVAIKVKPSAPEGKMVVFTAANEDQTAYPYKKQQHGMFTYYLLKKLQTTKGETTLGELGDYLQEEVRRQSFDENQKSQTPTVSASPSLNNTWRSMKL